LDRDLQRALKLPNWDLAVVLCYIRFDGMCISPLGCGKQSLEHGLQQV
jgi:hypothetical protein